MGVGAISCSIALLLVIPSVSPPVSLAQVASPSVVKGTFGDSITLPCDGSAYRGLPEDQLDVLWQTAEGEKVARYSHGVHSVGSNFKNRVTFPTEMRLGNFFITIKSIKSSDEGTYECVWSKGQDGQEFLSDVVLYVLTSDAVPSPSVVKRRFGVSVTLPCDGSAYSGLPEDQLDVLWLTSEGEKVARYSHGVQSVGLRFEERVAFHAERIRRGDFSITIKSVKFSDDDNYECVWSKGEKSEKHLKDVKLYVLAPHFSTSLSVHVGDSVTLPCYGHVNKHAPEDLFVQWKRGDELVLKRNSEGDAFGPKYDRRASVSSDWSHGNFSLSLNVTGLCDEGVYQCTIDQNQNLTSVLLELKDYGHFTPVNLRLWEDLTLRLPKEPVNVTFSKEGTLPRVILCSTDDTNEIKCDEPKCKSRMKLRSYNLTLQNVTSDDVGIYTVIYSQNGVVSQAYRVSIMPSNNNDRNFLLLLMLLPIPERVLCVVSAVLAACYFLFYLVKRNKNKKSVPANAVSDLSEGNRNLEETADEKTPFTMPDADAKDNIVLTRLSPNGVRGPSACREMQSTPLHNIPEPFS